MRIIALDLSLTRTGYATSTAAGVLVPPKNADRGMDRIKWVAEQIAQLVFRGASGALVVIEGYSFGSKGRAVFDIAELGGVIRYMLSDGPCTVVEVPPSCLKKYATGRGNAGKDEVLAAAIRRLGYAGHDNNEADALWLLQMATDHYGHGSVVPQAHREALSAVKWPKLSIPAPQGAQMAVTL